MKTRKRCQGSWYPNRGSKQAFFKYNVK